MVEIFEFEVLAVKLVSLVLLLVFSYVNNDNNNNSKVERKVSFCAVTRILID